MRILQEKCRTTARKARAYRGKGGQNTGTAFLALRLGVVLSLLIVEGEAPKSPLSLVKCLGSLTFSGAPVFQEFLHGTLFAKSIIVLYEYSLLIHQFFTQRRDTCSDGSKL